MKKKLLLIPVAMMAFTANLFATEPPPTRKVFEVYVDGVLWDIKCILTNGQCLPTVIIHS